MKEPRANESLNDDDEVSVTVKIRGHMAELIVALVDSQRYGSNSDVIMSALRMLEDAELQYQHHARGYKAQRALEELGDVFKIMKDTEKAEKIAEAEKFVGYEITTVDGEHTVTTFEEHPEKLPFVLKRTKLVDARRVVGVRQDGTRHVLKDNERRRS